MPSIPRIAVRPRLPGALLFLGLSVLLLLMLWPSAWTGNEENYFQLAHRRVAPEQFHEYHAIFDHSSIRIVPEYVLGSLVQRLGYEKAHVAARLGMALLYAAALATFFSSLSFAMIDALLVVVVFRLMGEQLIGAEWLFMGVEAKTVSYALLFVSLAFVNRQRWTAAALTLSAATYFHLLVGGFWALAIIGFQWLFTRDVKLLARTFALYVGSTLPLGIVAAREQLMTGAAALPDGVNVAKIYAERNSHHVLPFFSVAAFWSWLPGIVVTACITITLTVLVRRGGAPSMAVIPLIGCLHLWLALGLSFLDRNRYLLSRFYLFRPSSLALFLAIACVVKVLKTSVSDSGRLAWTLVVASAVLSFSWGLMKGQVDAIRVDRSFPDTRGVVAAVEAHSRPDDVVLLEPVERTADAYLTLHRAIHRPTLVTWKYVPTHPAEIARWDSLIRKREKIFAEGCGQPMDLPVRLLVAFHDDVAERLKTCGPVVWRSRHATLIQVSRH